MSSLVPLSCPSHASRARRRFRIATLAALIVAAPTALCAQVYLSHTDDAAPVPAGTLRMRVTTGWTRFDERFTAAGRRPLSDDIATDSLGTRQFPLLTPVERALQSLTSDPLTRLTFGRLAARSDARIVTTPIALEYGVTRRLSIGLVVPIVQTRRSIQLRVNLDSAGKVDSAGNVGFVPLRSRRDAATANALVFSGFKSAADSLAILIARCPANPNASGCAAVNANTADANATRVAAQQFADAVRAALGTDSSSANIAPRNKSGLANRIDDQRAALNARVQKYLGAGAGALSGVFTTPTPFSYVALQGTGGAQGLLQSPLGGGLDSIQTTSVLRLNGFTVGAQYLLLDHFQRDTLPRQGFETRIVIGGAYRFEPTFPDSARRFGVIPTGDGSGFELRSAMDVIRGNFGGTIAARYVKSLPRIADGPLLGDPEAFFPAPVFGPVTRTAGTVMAIDLTPRLLVGEWFALDGHYGFERTGAVSYDVSAPAASCGGCPPFAPSTAARTAQRVGIGLRYSTADAYMRGRSTTPIEVSITHLETISGDPGVPRVQRDQVQVRVFFKVRSGR